MTEAFKPVAGAERYAALDLIRGFALLGVLLVNLLCFFRLSLFDHMLHFHSHGRWVNHAIDVLIDEFVEFKAFDLFSVTFGIGVAVQAERAAARGVRVEWFLVRRFLVLLAFGTAHMILVSNVDILMLYAVCGLLLIPVLRLPAAAAGILGLAAIYLPSVFSSWRGLPGESELQAHVVQATRVYGSGSFGEILAFRGQETRDLILPLLIGVAQKTWGMMLLGVAVWRAGIVREPERHRWLLWAFSLVAGILGLLHRLGSHIPLALAYGAALLAWRRSERATALTAPVAAAGRMALTNYLTQSLVFAVLFYGYGFRLFGLLDPTAALLIGLALYAVQLWFSAWWLKRYRFGPFEWIWRSLTYGHRQPML